MGVCHVEIAPFHRITGLNGAVTTSYGYDTAGRLNSLTNNLPAASHNNQWTFAFNPAGQITQTTRSNDLFAWGGHYNVNRNYTANGLNQYTAAGPAAFCYDANGNLTADGASVYLYDVENRLIEKRAQGAGNTNCAALSYAGTLQAGLRYDPNGRLYEVTGAPGTTRMLYDGDALTAEYDAGGTLLRRYVHGADGAADDPVAWYEGAAFSAATERHLRPDWQGSVVLVTDSTGNTVLGVNRYDEYGIPQSSNTGRFQYTGQAWLAELGMYYYKARIYSPTLGRFLQTDPIGYDGGANLYAYAGGDPVNGVDPDGLAPLWLGGDGGLDGIEGSRMGGTRIESPLTRIFRRVQSSISKANAGEDRPRPTITGPRSRINWKDLSCYLGALCSPMTQPAQPPEQVTEQTPAKGNKQQNKAPPRRPDRPTTLPKPGTSDARTNTGRPVPATPVLPPTPPAPGMPWWIRWNPILLVFLLSGDTPQK